jgi:leucine dehydrogenase
MTYKAAMAGLRLGGGKSVIIGDPRQDKTEALLRSMGRFVNSLGGQYSTAEDSGTSVEDMRVIGEETPHVSGIRQKHNSDGSVRSGDPSPATAYGCFVGVRASVSQALGREDLSGVRVAIQGLGNVGYRLAKLLHEAGARLWVTDIREESVNQAVRELGATAVPQEDICAQEVDVFAPCALGSSINDDTLPRLQARVVAGAANNQLAEDRHGQALHDRGILYAPDYVINAGGLIDVCYEREGEDDPTRVWQHIDGLGDTLREIYDRSRREGRPTNEVADRIAEERFGLHKGSNAA